MLQGKRITLLVSGSIAAYKSAELVRLLIKERASVRVAMSKSAMEFITPLTLQTLSGAPVTTSLFDAAQEANIGHIRLADEADVIVVAPATANVIAKAALGIADDVVTSVLLATKAPVLFAPAMNVNMWESEATKENVGKLRVRGAFFVEPDSGELACGWVGKGRLAELEGIIQSVQKILSPQDLSGIRVVVSAGPTREFIDPVRFVGNRSSGKMGFALARAAWTRGAEVHLISGVSLENLPQGIRTYEVETALEMREEISKVLRINTNSDKAQLLLMAAAVADFRPSLKSSIKQNLSKKEARQIMLEPNPDILEEVCRDREEIQRTSGIPLSVVGFAAETAASEKELLIRAAEKLKRKNADAIVANIASESFERETNHVWLVFPNGESVEILTADKYIVSHNILSHLSSCGVIRH